jgi:hypothetical protein
MLEKPDYTTALFELFVSILQRTLLASEQSPLGAQWKEQAVAIKPALRFNAQVREMQGAPWYQYNFGVAISLLDACNELAADPLFFPESASHVNSQRQPFEENSSTRFVDYGVDSDEISLPVLDFSEDNRRLSLFDQIFAMACRFLALHEQGHYFLGHLTYNKQRNASHEALWLEAAEESQTALLPSVARAMELQADRFAFDLLFQNGLRLRDAPSTHSPSEADGPFDNILVFEEWLVKAAVGGLLVCGIFELSERNIEKTIDLRTHPTAAARTIALITSLRAVMVEHLASKAEADRVLDQIVKNAQRIYAVLNVLPLAENAMYTWINRNGSEEPAIVEYREAARILRTIRPELNSYAILAHRSFGVTAPEIDAELLVE